MGGGCVLSPPLVVPMGRDGGHQGSNPNKDDSLGEYSQSAIGFESRMFTREKPRRDGGLGQGDPIKASSQTTCLNQPEM